MTIYKIFSSCVCVKISRRRWTLTRAWHVSQSVESTRKTKANTLAWPTTNWVATLHPPASSSMVYNRLLPSFVFFLVFYSFSFPCNFVNNKKTIEPIKIMSGRLLNFFNQFDCYCCLTFDIFISSTLQTPNQWLTIRRTTWWFSWTRDRPALCRHALLRAPRPERLLRARSVLSHPSIPVINKKITII